jgi:tetratricopeptide (TPR) repeat protein
VELGQGERAEALFRQALGAEGGEQIARLHLGELLARSGRTAEGIAEFERAVETFPNHATLRNNLATALFIEERLEDAVGHYRVAVRLDPGYFNAWFNLGRALGELGRLDEAREALATAGGLRPGSAEVTEALDALGGG